jgi:hypothetical protein
MLELCEHAASCLCHDHGEWRGGMAVLGSCATANPCEGLKV